MKSENRKLLGSGVKPQATGQHLVVPEPHLRLTRTCVLSRGGVVVDLIRKSVREVQGLVHDTPANGHA